MTKENAKQFLPLVQAMIDGKTIQVSHYSTDEWKDWGWGSDSDFSFKGGPERYRIKPEPVMVPLGPEDVPPGSAFRWPEWPQGAWKISHEIDRHRVHFPCGVSPAGHSASYKDLTREGAQIKRPGEDWKPCCKPAPES